MREQPRLADAPGVGADTVGAMNPLLRALLVLLAAAAVALALRNATADKGGSYDPADRA